MLKREELRVDGRYINSDGHEVEVNAIGVNKVLCTRIETGVEYAWDIKDAMRDWRTAPPPKLKGKRFMNILKYKDGGIFSSTFTSREDADSGATFFVSGFERIACIEVDWTEGEGL